MATKEELYDRAVDEVAEGNLEAAVEAYRQALEIDPDYADVLEGLSMALADLGRLDEAIAAARRVVELVPDDQLSYTNLSRIYQRAGDVPQAEEWAAKGRVLDWKQQLRGAAAHGGEGAREADELTSSGDAHRGGAAAHGGEGAREADELTSSGDAHRSGAAAHGGEPKTDRVPYPVEVRRAAEQKQVRVAWSDGHLSEYPYAYLRGWCPCAGCQGHGGDKRYVHAAETELEKIEPVGKYALQFQWSDGHQTGIYTYRYLRELCACSECRKS